jgi:hypothetical protein
MSVLLTDEAVRAVAQEMTTWSGPVPGDIPGFMPFARRALEAANRAHATEGREALVVIVAKVMARECHSYPAWTLFKDQAEAVVTALVGEPR